MKMSLYRPCGQHMYLLLTEEFVGKAPDDDVGGAKTQFENAWSTIMLHPALTINHPLPAMTIVYSQR